MSVISLCNIEIGILKVKATSEVLKNEVGGHFSLINDFNINSEKFMQFGEISARLNSIENIQFKMDEAAGTALSVELRMRLLTELSQPVQIALKNKEYYKCELGHLEKAILLVFQDKLELGEKEKLTKFLNLRNKLMHGEFVSFAKLQGIVPKGQQIISSNTKNTLSMSNIKESILSVDWNQAFPEFRKLANEVKAIIDKLIFSHASN